MTLIYNVRTSEVSGLIGRNPFCPREQAILRFIKRMNYTKFNQLLRKINVREVSVIANELLSKNERIKNVFSTALKVSSNEELAKYKDKLYEEIQKTDFYKTKKDSLINEINSRINIKRGTAYEKKGVDNYEKVTGYKITDRNSEMIEKIIKRLPEYTIILRSKIDGVDRKNNCLIEHKNRVSKIYDEISDNEKVQLEIYMRVTGLKNCKLVQTHFDEVSEIEFKHSLAGWKKIKTCLIETMAGIHSLIENEEKLKKFMSKYRKYI